MPSHHYHVSLRELARVVLWPLLPVAFFALAMQGGARLHWLPAPRPELDIDQTILLHQVEASAEARAADLVLLGDSSCLMGVSAPQLAQQLPGRPAVLNLGTLSYLGLESFGSLLQRYRDHNPGSPRAVLLLVHPEMLGRASAVAEQQERLAALVGRTDVGPDPTWEGRVSSALGVGIFRGRLLARVVPQPLPGSYGQFYGFNTGLRAFLDQNLGSAVDPNQYLPGLARNEMAYSLAASQETAARGFRRALPAGVRLITGLMPSPESEVSPKHTAIWRAMLEQWSAWLEADVVLDRMPASLPDGLFASRTHLSRQGAEYYTRRLARELAAIRPALLDPAAPAGR